jgi:hypothetical protein
MEPKGAVMKALAANSSPAEYRFRVALSFPDEHRPFVLGIAELLAAKFLKHRIFYDEWYELDLLGADGDLKLQRMYKQATVVVPFFSEHYEKPWCRLEWATIRGILLNRHKEDAVLPVEMDATLIPGWPEVNYAIRWRDRSVQVIADLIIAFVERKFTPQPGA